jgi:magnesium transporter
MKRNVYRITADSVDELVDDTILFHDLAKEKDILWVDIHSYDIDELESWLGNLNLSDLAMKCCMEAGQTTRFMPLHQEVFVEFPTYAESVGSKIVQLSVLCKQNFILTLHVEPFPTFGGIINGLKSGLTIEAPTTAALVCLLVLMESAKSLKKSELVKADVFDLDDRMDRDPDAIRADEIIRHKRLLRTLDTTVAAQLDCFAFLGGLDKPFLDLRALSAQFQFAPSNVRAASQNADRLEKSIADIRQRFDMNQQDKTNHRLAILTILSAIFMPLTFIAGIYGMNFDKMPELHFSGSYPAVLIIMLLIAVGMYIYFKTRGWLD